MILSFKRQFPWGEPTNFKEKILAGVGYGPIAGPPKIHTIRAGSRWKAGDIIHMAYGVRTKNYEQFNKGIEGLQKVASVHEIEVIWYGFSFRDKPQVKVPVIKIDGECYDGYCTHIMYLAINDGFSSIVYFYRWFNKNFKGQIIHWTDYRYK